MRGLVLGVVTVLRAVARGGVEAENAATEELGLLKIRGAFTPYCTKRNILIFTAIDEASVFISSRVSGPQRHAFHRSWELTNLYSILLLETPLDITVPELLVANKPLRFKEVNCVSIANALFWNRFFCRGH